MDYEAIVELLRTCSRVAITAHEKPDGDALGASLGLARILRADGRDAFVYGLEPLAGRYRFLLEPGDLAAMTGAWWEGLDALIVLDSCDMDRPLARIREAVGRVRLVNIDHHESNDRFGDLNYVDAAASSCGELVLRLAHAAALPVPLSAAEALWAAIVTDTGRFSYENTSAETMRLAATLVEVGVQPARLSRALYESMEMKELRLLQRALTRLTFDPVLEVAYLALTAADFAAEACGPQNVHDIVNYARAVEPARAGLFFYEAMDGKSTKVSVRAAAPWDATAICKAHGGGGHERAAGCTIPGAYEHARESMLETIRACWGMSGAYPDAHTP